MPLKKRLRISWCQNQECRFDKKVYLYPTKLNLFCKKILHLLFNLFKLQGSKGCSEWRCCAWTVKRANWQVHSVSRATMAIPPQHNKFRVPVLMLKIVTFESHNSEST